MEMMATTKIERVPCGMLPDPCDEQDYLITGESIYDDPIHARVHRRGKGDWRIETGGTSLREDWLRFDSLQDVIEHLEEGGVDC